MADGAAAWYIRRSVTGRATRFAYGVSTKLPYDPSKREHRGKKLLRDFEGQYVTGIWNEIVPKVKLSDIKVEPVIDD